MGNKHFIHTIHVCIVHRHTRAHAASLMKQNEHHKNRCYIKIKIQKLSERRKKNSALTCKANHSVVLLAKQKYVHHRTTEVKEEDFEEREREKKTREEKKHKHYL